MSAALALVAQCRIDRLVHKADFERLLASRAIARSTHFAVHHLAEPASVGSASMTGMQRAKLSTGDEPLVTQPVNNSPDRHWLGCVLAKRLARRAVTRNLLRRQIRAALAERAARLPRGLWLVRLRAAWPASTFPSAASDSLRAAVRDELQRLFSPLALP